MRKPPLYIRNNEQLLFAMIIAKRRNISLLQAIEIVSPAYRSLYIEA